MKGLGICLRGIEGIAATEVQEIIGAVCVTEPTAIEFPIEKHEQLAELCYRSQSLTKALFLLCKVEVTEALDPSVEAMGRAVETSDIASWLKDRTFKVHCYREGEHEYRGQDIAESLGAVLVDMTQAKVSVSNPDITVYVYICLRQAYIGIDFAGFDLSKRDYRVFLHPNALNATLAYALVRIAGFRKGTLLDPFAGSGTIPIEAALHFQGISPHRFKKDKFAFHRFMKMELIDKPMKSDARIIGSDHLLKFLKATKNNAKLAGVDIDVTRMDLEWLDTKIDEASIDLIVTNPPSESKLNDPLHIEKLYKEFFHQAEYIVKKKGIIVLCVQRDGALRRALATFAITNEFSVWQGAQEMKVLTLSRES